jgi:hypothetical protein
LRVATSAQGSGTDIGQRDRALEGDRGGVTAVAMIKAPGCWSRVRYAPANLRLLAGERRERVLKALRWLRLLTPR